jgi:geranylgeranyl transferase type-2 subunit alpha
MHGRKRAEYKSRLEDPKTAAGLAQKAEQWHALVAALMERRPDTGATDEEPVQVEVEPDTIKTTLGLLEKALLVNPDPLHLWNHRREWIVLLGTETEPANTKKDCSDDQILQTELALTQASLQRNPKAYGAWMHRKWILRYRKPASEVLQNELVLCATFLQADERNFHCWNYRRFVVACLAGSWSGAWKKPPAMGTQLANTTSSTESSSQHIPLALLQFEWEFTHSKIQDNFSNFSAFHYRSQLLPLIVKEQPDPVAFWKDELQLVEDAICTEPDDQTAWWYHALLLLQEEEEDGSSHLPISELTERLQEQAALLRELLDESPGKWVLLGLHRVLKVLHIHPDEQKQLLQQLTQVDPDRAQRYRELLKRLEP